MEHFQRQNPEAFDISRTSSVYSQDSISKPSTAESYESRTTTSSRPVSYMNAVPARKPVKARPISTTTGLDGMQAARNTPVSTTLSKGLLIVAVAGTPHPSTIGFLGRMLKDGAYSAIILFGHEERERELKQLKMDIYALLGKMRLEIGVQLEPQNNWSEQVMSRVVGKALESGDDLHGVLCCPAFDDSRHIGSDILALEESEFARDWTRTVGFLRNVAKATIPILKPNHTSRSASGLFVVTEPTSELKSAGSVHKAGCDKLVTVLADSNLRLTIAYADTVLVPEPEPMDTNGRLHLSTQEGLQHTDEYDFAAGESPTKLWNIWALQDELNVAY